MVGALGAWGQKAGKDGKPPVSPEMVSDERMAIYHVVIAAYRNGTETLHVGEKTEVLDLKAPRKYDSTKLET